MPSTTTGPLYVTSSAPSKSRYTIWPSNWFGRGSTRTIPGSSGYKSAIPDNTRRSSKCSNRSRRRKTRCSGSSAATRRRCLRRRRSFSILRGIVLFPEEGSLVPCHGNDFQTVRTTARRLISRKRSAGGSQPGHIPLGPRARPFHTNIHYHASSAFVNKLGGGAFRKKLSHPH